MQDEGFLQTPSSALSPESKTESRQPHLPNHEPQQPHRSIPMRSRLGIEDVKRERCHEQRRVDPGDIQRRELREVPEVARRRGDFPRREGKELAHKWHRVDVVLPGLEATVAELGRDRLVVRVVVVREEGRDRDGDVRQNAVQLKSQVRLLHISET